MPTPGRSEILRLAKDAFRYHGCGFVVLLHDREEPHYGFLPELEELLEDEPEAKDLINSIAVAPETYFPEHEAVVAEARPEGIDVMVLWRGGTWVVGGIVWSATQ
jgi:hypothetical protein